MFLPRVSPTDLLINTISQSAARAAACVVGSLTGAAALVLRSLTVVGEVDHLGFKIRRSAGKDHTDPGPKPRPLSKIIHPR